MEAIYRQYDIQQTFTVTYHPASNGLVERTNRKNFEILRHEVGFIQEAWEDWLPQVAASINGAIISPTGKTPHYIVFARDLSHNNGSFVTSFTYFCHPTLVFYDKQTKPVLT